MSRLELGVLGEAHGYVPRSVQNGRCSVPRVSGGRSIGVTVVETEVAKEQSVTDENGRFILLAEITMPNPRLPRETLDYITDLLYDELETLRECCLVSKSWVPRARKHLFADLKFRSTDDLDSWKKTFPDPSNSPAHLTHTLTICCPQAVTAADVKAGGWIPTFSHVTRLRLDNQSTPGCLNTLLSPFHKFSPTLKSLHVDSASFSCTQIVHLVRSLTLLEDLTLVGRSTWEGNDNNTRGPQTTFLSTSGPALTGSLELVLLGGLETTACQLLHLPTGLRFRKLVLSWLFASDRRWTMELVARCSATLEFLDVTHSRLSTFILTLRWALEQQLITFVCRRRWPGFNRPLGSDKT